MNNRRRIVAGAAVLVAAGIAMSGCKSSTTSTASPSSTSTTPAASASAATKQMLPPKAELVASLAMLTQTSYDLTTSMAGGQMTGTGSIDPQAKKATLNEQGNIAGQKLNISATQDGTSLYVKLDLGPMTKQLGIDPTKWMQLDESKMTGKDALPFDLSKGDAMDLTGLLSKVDDVKQPDATHLTGTVDLAAATGVNSPDSSDLSKAGKLADNVPFTLTLDSQGRPTNLVIQGAKDLKNLTVTMAFSNFGQASPINPPAAADTVPAPASIYKFMNQG